MFESRSGKYSTRNKQQIVVQIENEANENNVDTSLNDESFSNLVENTVATFYDNQKQYQNSKMTSYLMILNDLFKKGLITIEEKSQLKELLFLNNDFLTSSLEIYLMLPDEQDLIDSLQRLLNT